MHKERKESLMRIIVGLIAAILLGAWGYLIGVLIIVNFFITLFTAKRNRQIAEFCEYWNTTYYDFYRYITFVSNKRPFPFNGMHRISKFE